MGELLKVLRVYIVLAILTAVGLIAYHVVATYRWMRMPEDYAMMNPVVRGGQVFRLDTTGAEPGRLKRNDIVAYLKDPKDPDSILLGRVVALPGERIAISKGDLRLNGERLSEEGRATPTEGEVPEILIPRDHCYVLVDARNDGAFRNAPGDADSRGFGPIPFCRLLGRVIL